MVRMFVRHPVADFDSLDDVQNFAQSERLRDAMGEAGVTGEPEIWLTARA